MKSARKGIPVKHDPHKRLIEEYFPARELSQQARREKKGHPPTYQMHYWWSRKPLVVSRAAVLASLLSPSMDLDEFHKILGFADVAPPYARSYTPAEKEMLAEMRVIPSGQALIVDPFAGGGSIPFEALRAGFSCVSLDINPVAWLIQKVTLDFPRRFGPAFSVTIEQFARKVIEEVALALGKFYPTIDGKTVIAYLYAWEVQCPSCGAKVPLVNSWKLVGKPPAKSGERGKSAFLKPQYNAAEKTVTFEIGTRGQAPKGNCVRARGWCLNPECKAKISNEWIRQQIREHPAERLLAVIVAGSNGKEYFIPPKEQIEVISRVEAHWREHAETFLQEDVVPRETIPPDPRAATIYLYLDTWDQVANPRQRLLLVELVRTIRMVTGQAIKEIGVDQGKAIAMYLACLLAKHLNRNCRITSWDVQGEKIVHACSNKLNALQWNHAEINPFADVSGSLEYSLHDLLAGYFFAATELTPGPGQSLPELTIANAPVSALESLVTQPVDLIITDPPYYDDAPYGEISEFFFTWESRAIGKYISSENPLFASCVTPKAEDISVSRARKGNHFGDAFVKACLALNQVLADGGRLVLFFAHSGWDAWNAVLEALIRAHFEITTTWPVHTESLGITNTGKTASLSSLVLIARKLPAEEQTTAQIIPKDLDHLMRQHWNEKMPRLWEMGFRGLDLLAGVTGLALESLSGLKISTLSARESLNYDVFASIKEFVINFTLRQVDMDPDTLVPLAKFYHFFHGIEMLEIPIAFAKMIAETLQIPRSSMLELCNSPSNHSDVKSSRVIRLMSKEDFAKKSEGLKGLKVK